MKEYHVQWEIEICADSAEDAARKALEIQRDPNSLATVFRVADLKKGWIDIDLTDIDNREVPS